jgi:hypothetical protein
VYDKCQVKGARKKKTSKGGQQLFLALYVCVMDYTIFVVVAGGNAPRLLKVGISEHIVVRQSACSTWNTSVKTWYW